MSLIPGATTCLLHIFTNYCSPWMQFHVPPPSLLPCLLACSTHLCPPSSKKTQTWNMIISLFVFLLCTVPREAFHPRPHPGAKVRGPEWSWPALLVGRTNVMYSTVGVSIAQQATTYPHTSFPCSTIFSCPKGTSCFQLPGQKSLVQGRSPSAHTEAS